jgi:hypothetical protein
MLDKYKEPAVAISDFEKAIGNRDARLILVRIMRDGTSVEPE